jgi:replication-associated recombination protein RarA
MAGGRGKFGTINGHTLFECSSAMQKCIRRGMVDEAMYFAVELDLSGYGEYCWRRLKAIASEDIGLANPTLPSVLGALYDSWADFAAREQKTDRLFLGHAVLLLATSPKSRAIDNFQIVHYSTHDQVQEVPDFAFDMHTQKGKAMGRGMEHFYTESIRVDHVPTDPPHRLEMLIDRGQDPWQEKARRLKTSGIVSVDKQPRKKTERQRTLEENIRGEEETSGEDRDS